MNKPRIHDHPEGRVSSRSTSVLRLERNNKDLLQLQKMLSCYRCEPKTYERFEELAELKMRLQELRKSNLGIISAIHNGGEFQKGNLGRVRKQLLEFNELQKRVVRYSNPIRSVG
tara:strand:+ start:3659 stop:4003 length:345 start_codon:yes stop_codon:yes gene_type:complete